jgi:hypothetical protein
MALYLNTEETIKQVLLEPTVWDDIRISGLHITLGADAPDLVAFGKAYAFAGAGAISEQAYFSIQLPHRYKEGTDIVPHIHWSPTTNDAGSVVWFLEYAWVNRGGTFPASTTIFTVAVVGGGTALTHNYSTFSPVTGVDKSISSILMCRVFRDPTYIDDTYAFDAILLEFDFHFKVNTLGSKQQAVK